MMTALSPVTFAQFSRRKAFLCCSSLFASLVRALPQSREHGKDYLIMSRPGQPRYGVRLVVLIFRLEGTEELNLEIFPFPNYRCR